MYAYVRVWARVRACMYFDNYMSCLESFCGKLGTPQGLLPPMHVIHNNNINTTYVSCTLFAFSLLVGLLVEA